MKIENEFTVSAPVERAWEFMLDLQRVAPCLPGAEIQEATGEDEYKGTMAVKIGPVTANYKGTVQVEEADEENRRAVLHASGRETRGQGTASATITSTMTEESDGTRVSVETDMKLTGRAAQFGRGIAQDVATKLLGQFSECLEERISGSASGATEEPEAAAATSDSAPEATTNGSAGPEDVPPVVGAGGTAGQVISGGPASLGAGTVEGGVVAGPGAVDEPPAAAQETARPTARSSEERQAPAGGTEPLDLGAASQEAILKRAVPVLAGIGVLAVIIWLIRRR